MSLSKRSPVALLASEDERGLPQPTAVARVWSAGWALAALGPLGLSASTRPLATVALVALGTLVVAVGSALLYRRLASGPSRVAGSLAYGAVWLAGLILVLGLRPALAEVHELFGLHLGTALAGGLIGVATTIASGAGRSGPALSRWILLPILVGVFWSVVLALGIQIVILAWYGLFHLAFKPILGAESAMPLSALAGGALGGAFAGYFCALVLGFGHEP